MNFTLFVSMSILRIVRMEFSAESLPAFLALFEKIKNDIRHFPGCEQLRLYEDARFPLVRYTYSHWESEDALEAYRKSDLFGQVWPKTKQLFAGKPRAYSLVSPQEI